MAQENQGACGESVTPTLSKLALLTALVMVLPGCGGGDGGSVTAPPSPTPPPTPVRTLIVESSASLPETFFFVRSFMTTATGTLEARMDWTFASNTIWVFIAEGNCTVEQFMKLQCPNEPTCECRFLVLSQSSVPKPRVLTLPNAAPGTRTLVGWNLGPSDESVSYQVILETVGSSSASSMSAPRVSMKQAVGYKDKARKP